MRSRIFTQRAILSIVAATMLLLAPASFSAAAPPPPPVVARAAAAAVMVVVVVAPAQASSIGINGFYSTDKVQRGRMVQAAIVLDIPRGLHVNANKPLGKYAVPTTVKIDASGGVRISPVSYPRGAVRNFKFSDERLAVYEGRTLLRFNVNVPANFQPGVTELRVRVRFQTCSDEVCYPPANRDVTLPIGVVGASDPVKRINANIFGSGRKGRG